MLIHDHAVDSAAAKAQQNYKSIKVLEAASDSFLYTLLLLY